MSRSGSDRASYPSMESAMSGTIESAASRATGPTRTSWQGERMSVEEFLALPDDGVHRELIRGCVRELGMTARDRFHSRIEANITYYLVDWLKKLPKPRGEVVCGEAGFRLKGTRD